MFANRITNINQGSCESPQDEMASLQKFTLLLFMKNQLEKNIQALNQN